MFLVFEGGDGAGKTTQCRLLSQWLQRAGHQVLQTRQPGGTELGDRLRELLLSRREPEVDPRAEALLYAADKAQHVAEVIRPALVAGQIVVCDRYVDSMIAYQGAGRSLAAAEVRSLAEWGTGLLRPDLTVLLDVDPAAALAAKDSQDRVESAGADFHARVRDGFLTLAHADPDRYLVLSARQPRQALAAAVRERVTALLDASAALSDPSGTMGSRTGER